MRKILFLKLFFYCFVAFSQVGIGTDFPNTSAQLDIVSIDKGVLLPRIALIGTDDVTTISNGNKGGLLIYNTATTEGANEVTPGFYYWSESKNIWIGLTVNATTSRSGGIQLAGDLTGSASAPIVADGAITNIKLASTTGTESVVLSDSAILTGNPQAPTPATTDNSTALATTAFVKAVATSGNVADEINDGTTTVAPSQNAVFDALGLKVDKAAGERLITALEITTLENQMGTNTGDQDLSGFVTSTALDLKANLISPTFTGTPQAPTPLSADNSKTIATTAFVKAVATTSVTDAISDGETTMAPSQNAVFDALDSKENTITATSNTDYYRGDKTFQTLNKTVVGLPNVDNTNDADKPVSTATASALGLKEDAITATATADYYRGDKTFQTLNKTVVGLPNVDNTSDSDKPVSAATTTAMGLKEDAITATTTTDYYRGDKTFQTLNKAAVGLLNVDNTSDSDKPVSAATTTAMGLKEDAITATTTTDYYRGDKTFQTLNKTVVGLPNVDNTSDADKPVSTATASALGLKEDAISATTTTDYYRGDKTFQTLNKAAVGLPNVDNTSDADKPVSTATASALGLKEDAISATTTTDYYRGDKTFQTLNKTVVGLPNVDNTSDADKPVSTATASALGLKEDAISATTTTDYYRGDKTFQTLNKTVVGLPNVDNTSDADKPVSTATASALGLKEDAISATTTTDYYRGDKTFQTLNKAAVGLPNVDNTSDADKPVSTATTSALGLKEDAITATTTTDYYRGDKTFQTLNKTVVGLPNVDNTSDADKPVSTATASALGLKEDAISATTTTDYYRGDKTFQTLNKTVVGLPNVDNTSDADKPVSTATASALGLKEDAISATTTTDYYRGDKTFQTLNKTVVGLPNVDNTSDADKPVSTATASALGLKEDAISATTTTDYYRGDKTFQTLNKTVVGLPNVDNTSDADKPVSTATASALGLKEDAISATTTTDYYRGDKTFQTLNKAAVGLPNVDNTSDADKPVSTATASALGLKEDAISATTTTDYYRGDKTFQTLNKTVVGLPNVDNTSDADKPVSTATASALGLKEDAISATTTTDYYRGDKTFQTLNKAAVGLPNVDNTSDADKPVSTATQTALDLKVDKALLDGKIVIGNASNLGAAVTPNGDVTIDNLGETTIGASKVTYAKIQNVSATNRVLGRTSAGSGIVEEISTTGTGNVVMSNSPTLFTPNLGIPTTLVGTNITGTASGLTAGIANTVSSEDESADTTSFPLFVNSSGTQISQPKSNTFFKFNALTGQLATNSFSSSGLMSADGFLGTGGTTYTQNNNAKINGNVSLNSGTIDSPGIHFYSGNNSNWGIDNSSGALRFVKNLDEAAGIPYASFTANGSFLLQASSVFDIHGAALVVKAAYPKTPVEIQQDGALAHNAITFYNGNGLVGAIYTSGTTTAYATSSDENLKKNIVKAPEATEIARKMRTISYNFKLDNQFIEFGFGARELYKIYPDAVTAPEEGSWGLDYGRLTPILLKYTQEVDKRVSALETKESTALILEMVKNLQEKVNALQKELDLLKNKN